MDNTWIGFIVVVFTIIGTTGTAYRWLHQDIAELRGRMSSMEGRMSGLEGRMSHLEGTMTGFISGQQTK